MEPTREQVDALPGATLVEFGASWCGYCQTARPLIGAVLAEHPEVRHVQIEDGKGRRLGRSFGVKLWPTLVVMHDGSEVARVVRPHSIASPGFAGARSTPEGSAESIEQLRAALDAIQNRPSPLLGPLEAGTPID